MKCSKTLDAEGKITRLDSCGTKVSGTEISEVEYKMMRVAIRVFVNGEDAEQIKSESWWL